MFQRSFAPTCSEVEILVDVPWWTVGCEEEEYKKCYVEAGVILLQWSSDQSLSQESGYDKKSDEGSN